MQIPDGERFLEGRWEQPYPSTRLAVYPSSSLRQ